jgi:4-amino-4-deoxy-L-arabinose transferase-like glycosyltransferase
LCLLPFIAKPFNIDDPLFVWTAQHIAQYPLNPYGFSVVWYADSMPMSAVTKNPPLASYYAALFGQWTHWSEIALHIAFLLPAAVAVLATYELARDFTNRPTLAAALTLAAPGFLVSATSVMCDVPMLALWLLCILVWRRGLASGRWYVLVAAAFLLAVCTLTKYFGASLLPLLFLYSMVRQRRIGTWASYFAMPVVALLAYELWSRSVYGEGLLSSAMGYANVMHPRTEGSALAVLLLTLSFAGGCMLPVLFAGPMLFRKRWLLVMLALAAPGAVALAWNVFKSYSHIQHRGWVAAMLTFFITGGIAILVLFAQEVWLQRDADAILLGAWVGGTFVFTAFVNWTVNARSILPIIPGAALLIARRWDAAETRHPLSRWSLGLPIALSLAVGLWLAAGDYALARSARDAAFQIQTRFASSARKPFFTGHWGFQYYMQALGSEPVDLSRNNMLWSDFVVQPTNNASLYGFPANFVESAETFSLPIHTWISPGHHNVGAGFYSAEFGPLPYAFGPAPAEEYLILRFKAPAAPAAP